MACVFEVVSAFLWREGIEQLTDRHSQGFDGTSSGFTQFDALQ
jgi:hypothetical protein